MSPGRTPCPRRASPQRLEGGDHGAGAHGPRVGARGGRGVRRPALDLQRRAPRATATMAAANPSAVATTITPAVGVAHDCRLLGAIGDHQRPPVRQVVEHLDRHARGRCTGSVVAGWTVAMTSGSSAAISSASARARCAATPGEARAAPRPAGDDADELNGHLRLSHERSTARTSRSSPCAGSRASPTNRSRLARRGHAARRTVPGSPAAGGRPRRRVGRGPPAPARSTGNATRVDTARSARRSPGRNSRARRAGRCSPVGDVVLVEEVVRVAHVGEHRHAEMRARAPRKAISVSAGRKLELFST